MIIDYKLIINEFPGGCVCPSDDAKASKGCAGKYYILLKGAGLALIIICKSYLYIFFYHGNFHLL